MAMPLQPDTGMFPDTLVSPFVVAPEVAELAADVIASFDEFRGIAEAISQDGLRIRYVFETKEYDPVKEEVKPHTIAKVTKAGPLWKLLAQTELVIQFRQWFWDHFTEQERRGVLHHELTHVDITGEGADMKVSLREHDVEEFAQTALRFGPRRDNHQQLFRAFLAWERQQQPAEPRRLRPVDMEAVMDRVVDEVNAGAVGPNVTADRPSRTVTVEDVDVRPTGEVNVDELLGDVDRAVEPDSFADLPF